MGLPTGYKQLAYIESTGTQYVDTGFTPNNNTRVVLDAYNLSTGSGWTFGAWTSSSSLQYAFSCLSTYSFRYGTANVSLTTVPVGELKVDFNKNAYNLNGEVGTLTEQTFSCAYTMYLFAINAAGSVSGGKFTGRIKKCQIYDNGVLVRDYVPCINANGVAGLYDMVNDTFSADAAGGSFVAGPVVGVSAPSDFTVTETTQTSISLAWGAVDTAVGYILRRNGLKISDISEIFYTDSTAKPYREYTYAISAYNDEAESEAATLTASVLAPDGFVTVDYRTAADVERVKNLQNRIESGKATEAEISEWLDGLIGTYNAWDMNRVESAVDYLQTYLNGVQAALDAYRAERMVASDDFWVAPWDAISLITKKGWVLEDIPSESDLARYLSNVDAVTNALSIAKQLPETMERLDYIGANEIERVLRAEYDAGVAYETNAKWLIDNTRAAFIYSGEFYGGEI